MYTEASSPRRPGDKAVLMSANYPITPGSCLSFYYHMYGTRMGTFNVYLRQLFSVKKIFTKTGNQGNKWILGQATLQTTTNFSLLFEGVMGSGYDSDIAIDDVSISSGGCSLPGNVEYNFCLKI